MPNQVLIHGAGTTVPSVTFLSFVTLYKKHSTLVKNNFRIFRHCIPVKALSGNRFAPLYLETALGKIKEENKKIRTTRKEFKGRIPSHSRQQTGNGLSVSTNALTVSFGSSSPRWETIPYGNQNEQPSHFRRNERYFPGTQF